MTSQQYLRFYIVERHGLPNYIHECRKLYQQYIVDQYCKIELARLRYLRFNQKKLRSDLYSGVSDSVGRGDVHQSGCTIILPASFTGGERFMRQYYQNAMALVREYGKPTFFVTITCNIN